MTTNVKFALMVGLIIALVVVGPLLTIWALNTLFVLGIDYNLQTWFAVVLLGMFLQARVSNK